MKNKNLIVGQINEKELAIIPGRKLLHIYNQALIRKQNNLNGEYYYTDIQKKERQKLNRDLKKLSDEILGRLIKYENNTRLMHKEEDKHGN